MTATPLDLIGKENIPSGDAPYVIVLNHASYLDSFVIAATLPLPFHSVVKAEFAGRFLTRLPLEKLNAEFVERFDTGKSVEDAARLAKRLKEGAPLLFFAESTFSRAPGLQPFHMGAFKAAADAGVPVIPVAIRGTRSILHADSWFPHRGAITVTVGEALRPAEVAKEEGTDRSWLLALALRKRARDFILLHCGEADLTVQG
jgi:1-acyl-sn-glycerol-3-phosphate acyltransferase